MPLPQVGEAFEETRKTKSNVEAAILMGIKVRASSSFPMLFIPICRQYVKCLIICFDESSTMCKSV